MAKNTQSEIVRVAYLSFVTPGCAAALLDGPPGIGKTSMVHAMAAGVGAHCDAVISSIHEPADFGGYPVPDGDRLRFLPADWAVQAAERAKAGQKSLIVLDEVNLAPPAVQAALLRPVLERRVGSLQLDADLVRFLLVMNPSEFAAGAFDILAPLANRVTHYKVEDAGIDNYLAWLLGGDPGTAGLPAFDGAAWQSHHAAARGTAAAFIKARPAHLNESPDKARGRELMSYATRRSWTSLIALDATLRLFGWDDLFIKTASGSVGGPVGTEYAAYRRKMDLPDVEALLAGTEKFIHDPRREDRTFAALYAVAVAGCAQRPLGELEKRWNAAWEVMGDAMGQGAGKDLATVSARHLAVNRPKGRALLLGVQKLIQELAPMVAASALQEA